MLFLDAVLFTCPPQKTVVQIGTSNDACIATSGNTTHIVRPPISPNPCDSGTPSPFFTLPRNIGQCQEERR